MKKEQKEKIVKTARGFVKGLSDTIPLDELPAGKANVKVPPMFLSLMTGVSDATQYHDGRVRLTYTDGMQEAAVLGYDIALEENFFKVVSDVQAARSEI